MSRSSGSAISAGGRSLVSTICLPLRCSTLKRRSARSASLRPGELHVIEQQHIEVGEALAEDLGFTSRDRLMQMLDELVGGDVLDLQVGLELLGQLPDRREQMGFPESRGRVDEERVIRRARRLRDSARRRHGQTIGRADDERVEARARIDRHASRPQLRR